ncbi:MAG: flagellar biosynthetic protein FliR [Alphaproteobacteria bacterium]|nr:flagellar biosynthetic protein FliR [Alphaproteobacteria bacterium]
MTELFNITLYNYLMIFLRIGTVFMLMPGFSASYVNAQIRLVLALALSLVVMPIVTPLLPQEPTEFSIMLQYILREITIGIFLGIIMQVLFFSLNFAGSIASQAIGFANAQIFDPAFQTQTMLIETFLSIIAVTFIFITNTHHLMIEALIDSYHLFSPNVAPIWEDFSAHMTQTISRSFAFGFKLGSPFIAVTIIFYSGMGLVSRLMPQLNIFFLSLPLQIYLGVGLLFLTAPIIISVFFRYYDEGLYLFTN